MEKWNEQRRRQDREFLLQLLFESVDDPVLSVVLHDQEPCIYNEIEEGEIVRGRIRLRSLLAVPIRNRNGDLPVRNIICDPVSSVRQIPTKPQFRGLGCCHGQWFDQYLTHLHYCELRNNPEHNIGGRHRRGS